MTNAFFQTWTKYIPIIRILLKRSSKGEQSLDMNSSDFHRAAAGRKIKFNFSFTLINGKLQNLEAAPPLGRDLIDALLQDDFTNQFIRTSHLEFSMNKDFQLFIKNVTPAAEESLQTEEMEPGMEDEDTTSNTSAKDTGGEEQ